MQALYTQWMKTLYWFCVWVAGLAIAIMTIIIPWGVYTRYVLGTGSRWPEPLAVLLMVLFTFIGGAACYRANAHIAVHLFVGLLPAGGQKIVDWIVGGLMAVVSLFMVVWGFELCVTTWHQSIAEFPFLPVGVAYLPLPIGSAFTLFFIAEYLWCGPAKDLAESHDVVADVPEVD